jgi:propanol-preferring alcohol dehydrogenase
MVLERQRNPLVPRELPDPDPGSGQVRIRVSACGICRTDLHILDGELPDPKLPLIPGHQIVAVVDTVGDSVSGLEPGARVGVPWLGWTCGACDYCRSGRENLCDNARFTGYHLDGGYAEYAVADARYVFPLPGEMSDLQVAPLLCAGLIGYRAYRMAGEGERLGFYGFGAAAHILCQLARHEGRAVYAFTRPGDAESQRFARELGAVWAGGTDEPPPDKLDAAIIFAPSGELVPLALSHTRKGGTVVCAGIHMSDLPSFPYRLLWEERKLVSVANLTREDGETFLTLAPQANLHTEVTVYPLEAANLALDDLRHGRFQGAAVLETAEAP